MCCTKKWSIAPAPSTGEGNISTYKRNSTYLYSNSNHKEDLCSASSTLSTTPLQTGEGNGCRKSDTAPVWEEGASEGEAALLFKHLSQGYASRPHEDVSFGRVKANGDSLPDCVGVWFVPKALVPCCVPIAIGQMYFILLVFWKEIKNKKRYNLQI